MADKVKTITAFVTFEMTVDVPLEIADDPNAIQELIDEAVASDDILMNCVDSGESSREYY